MKTWPTLYKRTSTGALQEWTIFAAEGRYWTKFGQTGGTIQQSERVDCVSKNVGRANETSADQQAVLEAQALWEKKLKKDYTQDQNAKAGQASELIEGGILPMLAHKFSDQGDKLKYPCFVQPKLDGHRCIAMPGGELWSRTRKLITGVPHIVKAIQELGLSTIALDGELYNHAYCDKFEQLSSFIKQKVPKPGYEAVQYHVYDAVMTGHSFRDRNQWLNETLWRYRSTKGVEIVVVETREVANEDELMLAFEDFLAQGYEGAIARNANGAYVNKRSYDLLKIKKFDDAEFWCVAVEEGKGKMAGHAIFVCKNADGSALFKAKMKGDHLSLVKYFEHPELVVNKRVTVKYQGLTNKNGVPRFPVALRVRED
jgi:DNA ligase-1